MNKLVLLTAALLLSTAIQARNIDKTNYKSVNIDSLQFLAQKGNARAMHDLGLVYSFENSQEAYKKCFEWWTKATEKGDSESAYRLALLYHFGLGTERDPIAAVETMMKSTYANDEIIASDFPDLHFMTGRHPRANYVYGKACIKGFGTTKNVKEGLRYLNSSNLPEAYHYLGVLYENGEEVTKDWDKAIAYYRSAAMGGNYEDLALIAVSHWKGNILQQDKMKALEEFKTCYENGFVWETNRHINASIPYIIGLLYLDETIPTHNPQIGIGYLAMGADLGDANAMLELGKIHYFGKYDRTVDYSKAVEWLTKAQDQHSNSSEVYQLLSNCYRHGRGVERNLETADKYAETANRLDNAAQDKKRILELKGELDQHKGVDPNIEMVAIKGGPITIGATERQKAKAYDKEYPPLNVSVNDFKIGKYEVTQKQWLDVMGYNNAKVKGDNLPVHNVSWQEINLFIERLNAITGLSYRLPTEAEWEYAARGGQASADYLYIGGDVLEEVAWRDKNLHEVGQKKPNELGLYDMAGNVWEWCADNLGGYGQYEQGTNPVGSFDDESAIRRGGSSYYFEWGCRPAFRGTAGKGEIRPDTGFRLALD